MDNYSPLYHDSKIFEEENIFYICSYYGIEKRYVLERHLWAYEILGHIQKLSKERCVLKGGACVQLYLPLEYQRCTADLDFITNLTKNEIISILSKIKNDFNEKNIKCSFKEYIPSKGKDLPMVTFLIDVPFHFFCGKKKKRLPIKLDFLMLPLNNIETYYLHNGKTFSMDLNYVPICISLHTIIGDKLLTFAVNSIGLDLFRIDSFYKNIYDLYFLISCNNNEYTIKNTIPILENSLSLELELKKLKSIHINKILKDILNTLLYFSFVDLTYTKNKPPKKLINFQKNYIQYNLKKDLDEDMWSIMSMFLYLWTISFRKNKKGKNINFYIVRDTIKKDYTHYLSLNSKNKHKYIVNLKVKINKMNKYITLDKIKNPLRIIYIYNLLYI